MSDVAPVRVNIPQAAVNFRSAVSEYLANSLASQQNFLNYFTYDTKQFFINGPYSVTGGSQQAVDGAMIFEFNTQIIDCWMFNITAGSSGTTQLDVQIANNSGTGLGSWTSIFNTLPVINFNASHPCWVGNPVSSIVGSNFNYPSYTSPSNTSQPVLNTSVTNFIPAFTAIRVDLVQSQVGGQNCGILIHYRNI